MSNEIYCSRRFIFDCAHRVIGHTGKCRFLHGHRYVCEASFVAKELNALGMVIDFAEIKDKLGGWLDDNFDHNLVLSSQDKELAEQISKYTKQKTYFLETNPTSENMALHLLHVVCPKLFANTGARCVKIRLYESENSFVEVGAE